MLLMCSQICSEIKVVPRIGRFGDLSACFALMVSPLARQLGCAFSDDLRSTQRCGILSIVISGYGVFELIVVQKAHCDMKFLFVFFAALAEKNCPHQAFVLHFS